jgi:hypothetical protein
VDISDEPDMFGISYKPYNKQTNDTSYTLPSVDDDLDLDLKVDVDLNDKVKKISLSQEEEDDEFNVPLENIAPNSDINTKSSPSQLSIKESVAKASKGNTQSEEDILASIQADVDDIEKQNADLLKQQEDAKNMGKEKENNSASKKNGIDDVKNNQETIMNAFDTVSQMYGSGGGDALVKLELESQEDFNSVTKNVDLMQKAKNSKSNNKGQKKDDLTVEIVPLSRKDMNAVTIAEGDEDEEEEEEEEQGDDGNTNIQDDIVGGFSSIIDRHRSEADPMAKAMQDEWNAVDAQTLADLEERVQQVEAEKLQESQPFECLAYTEALSLLKRTDLSAYNGIITPFEPREEKKTMMSIIGLKTTRKITALQHAQLEGDGESSLHFPFLLAHLNYDHENDIHLQLLQTIFHHLVLHNRQINKAKGVYNGKAHLPKTGPHWDLVGFQGLDPATDVNRAMKMLALLQALHYCEYYGDESKDLHYLSILTKEHIDNGSDKDLSWPFMCVSINFTKLALVALRQGELNEHINMTGNVMGTLHTYYRAAFYDFKLNLIDQPQTHHAYHLSGLTKKCDESPLEILAVYKQAVTNKTVTPKTLIWKLAKEGRIKAGMETNATGGTGDAFEGDFSDFEKMKSDTTGEADVGIDMAGKASKFLA